MCPGGSAPWVDRSSRLMARPASASPVPRPMPVATRLVSSERPALEPRECWCRPWTRSRGRLTRCRRAVDANHQHKGSPQATAADFNCLSPGPRSSSIAAPLPGDRVARCRRHSLHGHSRPVAGRLCDESILLILTISRRHCNLSSYRPARQRARPRAGPIKTTPNASNIG